MAWNATASGGGLAFPLQNLMAAYGPTQPINDWIFQKAGATIDTPTNLTAAQHLQQWVKDGYFPKDANAIEYTDANARFGKGEGVFMFNGDWQNADLQHGPAGNVGFFTFPPAEAGGSLAAMSAPLTYGIADKSKNADCAAAFFNWVATNENAREIDVAVGGANPGGPTDLAVPPAAAGSVINETLDAGAAVAKRQRRDGLHRQRHELDLRRELDTRAPEAGRRQEDAAGLLKDVQAEYEKELSSSHAADEAQPRQAMPPASASAARRRHSRRIPWPGSAAQTIVGWLFVLPALAFYAMFVLQPLLLSLQYSLYDWNGVGPATWVGLDNYATVFSDDELLEPIFNAFKLIVFFSFIPVALGLVDGHRSSAEPRAAASGRCRGPCCSCPQIIPLVAAGIMWNWVLRQSGPSTSS